MNKLFLIILLLMPNLAHAVTLEVSTSGATSNLGIGTTYTGNKLTVAGATAIGSTYQYSAAPTNGLLVAGNVGIASVAPGQALDVTGIVRSSSGFQSLANGIATVSTNQGIGFDPVNNVYTTPKLILNTTGNVGINTSTSNFNLQVAGSLGTNSFTLNNGATTGYVLQTNSVGVGTWVSPTSIGAGGGLSGHTTNKIAKATSSTTIGDSQIFDNGTNIGIGSTNPGVFLDVAGAIRSTGAGNTLLNPTGGNVGIGTATPGVLFDVNGAIRSIGSGDTLLNSTSGNVGIGTASPAYAGLTVGTGKGVQLVGVGTTVPQQLCKDAAGHIGYFNGAWSSTCTAP